MMQKVSAFLQENPDGYLATTEAGKPRVRPFQFQFEEDGKFYFCTATTKPVYQQLQQTAFIEFCSSSKNGAWLRLSGPIVFSPDRSLKQRILDASPMIRGIYQTPDNPVFAIFYLEHGQASISDFSGNPPQTFNF